jgi:hypothetical protein
MLGSRFVEDTATDDAERKHRQKLEEAVERAQEDLGRQAEAPRAPAGAGDPQAADAPKPPT